MSVGAVKDELPIDQHSAFLACLLSAEVNLEPILLLFSRPKNALAYFVGLSLSITCQKAYMIGSSEKCSSLFCWIVMYEENQVLRMLSHCANVFKTLYGCKLGISVIS